MNAVQAIKLKIFDIFTNLYLRFKKNIEIREYEQIIPLGFNCSLAYNLNRVNGFIESSLFNWAYVKDNNGFLKALENPDVILNGEYIYKPDYNMFECENTHIVFHGRSKVKKIKNPNPEVYNENIKNEYDDLKSRTLHLIEKFKTLLKTDTRKLFIMVLNPFNHSSYEENSEFINNTYRILKGKTNNFDLLVICLEETFDKIKNQIDNAIILKSVNKFAPVGDAVNPDKNDIQNFNIILKQYRPKVYKKSNKKYKYEKDE